MVDVANAARRTDQDPEVDSVERMRNEYANLTNSDPATDLLVAEIDGTIVAYAHLMWEDQNDGDRAYIAFGYVHPEAAPARARHGHVASRRAPPARDRDRASLRRNQLSLVVDGRQQRWQRCALTGQGYRKHRYLYLMVRPDLENLEQLPMPDGLQIRPVQPDHLRALFAADNDAFRDDFGFINSSEAGYRRWTGHETSSIRSCSSWRGTATRSRPAS